MVMKHIALPDVDYLITLQRNVGNSTFNIIVSCKRFRSCINHNS